ncbi:unnamed protein product [Symbiodinium sp. CCMP2456]|nr:unnamed protein product [Symbiodinium sp. CCMP2456]
MGNSHGSEGYPRMVAKVLWQGTAVVRVPALLQTRVDKAVTRLKKQSDAASHTYLKAPLAGNASSGRLNISLTPLANVLAHGRYDLGQEIVLFKLLGDFVGRVLFFLLPSPRRLRLHLWLNWAVALLRLPAWIVLVLHAASKDIILGDVLLLVIWFPFVVTAALCGSWLQVVAIQAVEEPAKRGTAAQMNVAVYLGFLSGVVFAAAFSIAAKDAS